MYTPPIGTAADLVLEAYTPPVGTAANFDLDGGTPPIPTNTGNFFLFM